LLNSQVVYLQRLDTLLIAINFTADVCNRTRCGSKSAVVLAGNRCPFSLLSVLILACERRREQLPTHRLLVGMLTQMESLLAINSLDTCRWRSKRPEMTG
jgi:hypothetical protein